MLRKVSSCEPVLAKLSYGSRAYADFLKVLLSSVSSEPEFYHVNGFENAQTSTEYLKRQVED
jgi:hypothetical protein